MIDPFIKEGRHLWRLATTEPIETAIKLWVHVAQIPERLGPGPQYQLTPYVVTDDWERRLHDILGVPWPCHCGAEFWALWAEVLRPFQAKKIRIGRGGLGGWGDGDPGSKRAVWCVVRHLKPANVVETGVARGFTSRIVLEALERNKAGHLWSIDLPPSRHPDLHEQIGAAVGDELRHRWSYIKGSSRRHLPRLLAQLGQIDLFIHDSAHTEYNMRFELNRAWAALKPGGFAMIDDADYNSSFHTFMQKNPGHFVLVCHAEPLEPDPIRFDAKGLFGIARK